MIQTAFCTTNLIFLTFLLSSIAIAQEVTRTATLTPFTTFSNGAKIINNIQEVSQSHNAWLVNVLSQSSWHFILSLNSNWGFDSQRPSAISLTINSPSIRTSDLLFGFTTNNDHYISMALPMDNAGRDTKIYPQCDTMTAGIGDIAALPDFDRNCDIAGGSCTNWHNAPFNTRHLALSPPITFTLQNDPVRNTLDIYLSPATFAAGVSKCTFAAFHADEGLKIYMAGNDAGHTFVVSSFDVVATVEQLAVSSTTSTTTAAPIVVSSSTTSTSTAAPINTLPSALPVIPPAAKAPIVSTSTAAPTKALTTGPGQEFGAFGQLCAAASPYSICQSANDIATSGSSNFMKCERNYDCCLCAAVQCGDAEVGCRRFSAGPAGVFSVKAIDIQGIESGATIDCFGIESCALSEISGTKIGTIRAANDYSLKNAKLIITDPVPGLSLDCIGVGSCEGLEILMELTGPPVGFECNPNNVFDVIEWDGIRCGGVDSCKDMKVTVTNDGCHSLDVGSLECVDQSSCAGAMFTMNGDAQFSNCGLTGTAHEVHGIERCFENLENLACPDTTSCRNAVRTLTNPTNGFMLTCGDSGACAGAQLTMNVNQNAVEPVQYFDGFKFSGAGSGSGATIIVNNNQQNVFLEIERVECTAAESCVDTTFILGNDVQITEFACGAGSCAGCQIKHGANMAGVPCDPNAIPSYV